MNAAALLALQEIDTALDAIANRRPRLPEVAAHAAATAALTELLQRKAAVQLRIDAAQAAIEAAEAESHTLTTKRTRLETQLKTIISPREAEALMNQIAGLNTHRDELDDQELAALEAQAEAEDELASIAGQAPELHQALATTRDALDEVNGVLDAEVLALGARRAEAEAALAPAEIAAYREARHHGGGVGVAKLDGSRCGGCHLDLSPMELDVVKGVAADQQAECPQCGRFLVR